MRTALASSGPAVAGSALTVTLALLTLLFASLGGNRSIGWTSALGVVVVVVCALVVLPAALVLCGRRLFWPVHPPRRGPRPLPPRPVGPHRAGRRRPPCRRRSGVRGGPGRLCPPHPGARLGLSDTEQVRVTS